MTFPSEKICGISMKYGELQASTFKIWKLTLILPHFEFNHRKRFYEALDRPLRPFYSKILLLVSLYIVKNRVIEADSSLENIIAIADCSASTITLIALLIIYEQLSTLEGVFSEMNIIYEIESKLSFETNKNISKESLYWFIFHVVWYVVMLSYEIYLSLDMDLWTYFKIFVMHKCIYLMLCFQLFFMSMNTYFQFHFLIISNSPKNITASRVVEVMKIQEYIHSTYMKFFRCNSSVILLKSGTEFFSILVTLSWLFVPQKDYPLAFIWKIWCLMWALISFIKFIVTTKTATNTGRMVSDH